VPGPGACARFFDVRGHPAFEAHLAVHPTDPRTVLLTWKDEPPDLHAFAHDIWAALTQDDGATWKVTQLFDPSVNDTTPPGFVNHEFDSVARFGPDGTAYVLYGGSLTRVQPLPEATGLQANVDGSTRMTVARSRDGGGSWSYHPLHGMAGDAFLADFMDLAVAPDTGQLYVAAHVLTGTPLILGTWLWTSADQGATWSLGMPVRVPTPLDDPLFPRLAAGRGGLLALTTLDPGVGDLAGNAAPDAMVAVSRDGGATFESPVVVAKDLDTVTGEVWPSVWHPPGQPARIEVLVPSARDLTLVRSGDAGATWDAPLRLAQAPEGTRHGWAVLSHGPDGAAYALRRFGSAEPDRFGLDMLRLRPGGAVERADLADTPDRPGAYRVGDDYGGLAVGPDGRAWAAWSDPRGEHPRIALARLG
jgi:hypothetical protein